MNRVLDAATLISPTIDNYLGNALGLTGSGIFIMIVILPWWEFESHSGEILFSIPPKSTIKHPLKDYFCVRKVLLHKNTKMLFVEKGTRSKSVYRQKLRYGLIHGRYDTLWLFHWKNKNKKIKTSRIPDQYDRGKIIMDCIGGSNIPIAI